MFFDGLSKDSFAITNADDRNGMIMVQNCAANVKTYSTRAAADFKGASSKKASRACSSKSTDAK